MTNSSLDDNFTLAADEIHNIWQTINSSPSDSFSYWIQLTTLTFSLFGSISNLMSVIVLIKLSKKLSTFVYLTSLSLSDMITCITVSIIHLIDLFLQSRRPLWISVFLRHVEIFTGALAAGSRVLSLWISLSVTVDRWILICHPVYGKRICRIARAKFISRTISLAALIYSIPLIFEYEVIEIPVFNQIHWFDLNESSFLDLNKKSSDNNLLIIKGYSDLAKRRLFRWSYMFFNTIFVYLLPTLTIIILNIQLIRALHRLKTRRRRFKAVGHPSKKPARYRFRHSKYSVTLMVISIVLSLIICRSPTIVIWILWSFELTIKIFFQSSFSCLVRRFHSVANLIATINAATNFIPFCVFGQLFRSRCFDIYCCRPFNKIQSNKQMKKNRNRQRFIELDVERQIPLKVVEQIGGNRNQVATQTTDQFLTRKLRSMRSGSVSDLNPSDNQSSCSLPTTNVLRLSDVANNFRGLNQNGNRTSFNGTRSIWLHFAPTFSDIASSVDLVQAEDLDSISTHSNRRQCPLSKIVRMFAERTRYLLFWRDATPFTARMIIRSK